MEVDEKEKENQLQDERYDRTVRALTAEVALKIMKSRVAITPLNGTTTEFMKNIILDGANVTMFDDSPINEDDLGTNFMFSPQDLGKVKGEVLKQKFNEMNPYSQIEYKPLLNVRELYQAVSTGGDILKDYDVLAVSTTSFAEMILWDKISTLLHKPLYILNCCGLGGFIWINLGSKFTYQRVKPKVEVLNVLDGDEKQGGEEEKEERETVEVTCKSLEECLNPNVRGKSAVFYGIQMMYEAEKKGLRYDPFNPNEETLRQITEIGKQYYTTNKMKFNEASETAIK